MTKAMMAFPESGKGFFMPFAFPFRKKIPILESYKIESFRKQIFCGNAIANMQDSQYNISSRET